MPDDASSTLDPAQVFVHLVPTLFAPDDLAGGVAVMIDVLRASTTICTALDAGAEAVVPLSEVPRTLALARSDASGIAGGEREGKPPEGFDLGNSPSDYTAESVGGRVVYFTTSNGTQALQRMRQADEVIIASFVNRAAVIAYLRDQTRPIHFVCAGTDGAKTAEDILLAGCLARDLIGPAGLDCPIGTQLAVDHFTTREDNLRQTVRSGRGGRNLIDIGLEKDIDDALEHNRINLVPIWNLRTNRLAIAKNRSPGKPNDNRPTQKSPEPAADTAAESQADGADASDDGLGGW